MDILKIHRVAGEILEFIDCKEFEPQEKMAALKSASSVIEQVLAAESFVVMMANMLTKK